MLSIAILIVFAIGTVIIDLRKAYDIVSRLRREGMDSILLLLLRHGFDPTVAAPPITTYVFHGRQTVSWQSFKCEEMANGA